MKRRLILVAALLTPGCGTDLGDLKDERAEQAVVPALEDVECLFAGSCPWGYEANMGETQTVPHLMPPFSAVGQMSNKCTYVAISPYTALTAGHCALYAIDNPTTITLIPQSVLGTSAYEEEKTVVKIENVGLDKALMTIGGLDFFSYTPECREEGVAGDPAVVLGYPLNYGGGEVPQVLTTEYRSDLFVEGDWGGGGSGSPVYLHFDTGDQCVAGLLVEIASPTTHLVQRYVQ